MNVLVAVLAFIVAIEYAVIAFDIVPRLAGIASIDRRTALAARWGATAFLAGCAITHTVIGVQTLYPSLRGGTDMDMATTGGDTALLLQMLLPHMAQILGGAGFIWISRSRLEVSITSKAQAAELRELDRQLKSAFDRAPLGIALSAPVGHSAGGRYVNPAYLDIFGSVTAGPMSDANIISKVHPEDRAGVTASVRRAQSGESVDLEFRIGRADGPVRWIHARLSPGVDDSAAADRVTTILEDVTDRVNAHAALIDSERRFTQLADNVSFGISLRQLDPPKFLFANAAYREITGTNPTTNGDSPYDTVRSLIHPDDRDWVMARYWAPAQAGEMVDAEFRVLRPDGQLRWVHVTSNPVLDDRGAITRVAGTVEDTTARKAGEAAKAAQLVAERANLAKSEFLSRMSHELRTPLNAVLGFGQLLELDPLTDSQSGAVGHILGAGRHLLTLIDEVLDLSRIETNQLEITLEPVEVGQLLGEIIGLMRPAAMAANIALTQDPKPDGLTGIYVRADRRRLQQALLNLLSNALKYNKPRGSVRVGCAAGRAGQVLLTVADTGIGIREQDLPRLFTPFDRLGQQRTDIEGTGIGLSLTHQLVTAMGGDLRVESDFGEGSTFTVELPRVDPPIGTTGPATHPTEPAAVDPAGSMSTLLYIEDNRANAELMSRIVGRRPNWSLTLAADGRAGLELATRTVPTLIMLDLHLPDIHGIDVLRMLRAEPLTANIPVIILSADASPQEIARLNTAGARRYRTKPLDITGILQDLDEHRVSATAGMVDLTRSP